MLWPPADADHLLVTADQMLTLEQQWLASGLPVAALMESVGQGMAEWCLQRPERLQHGVLVLVGPGHNGGDGLVLGRKLREAGVAVRVWAPLPLRQSLTQEHWRHLLWLGVSPLTAPPAPGDPALWIDALFGLGQKRPLPSDLADLLQRRHRQAPGRLISLDVPAGLHSDSGCPVEGVAARASDTLCVGLIKRGLVQDSALDFVGGLHRIDPGVPERLCAALPAPVMRRLMPSDLTTLPRPEQSQTAMKYQRGRLLLVAGSDRYRGAALLALQGAMASGIGSVEACVPAAVAEQLWQLAPEVVLDGSLRSDAAGALDWGAAMGARDWSRLDALLIGPGWGRIEAPWDPWAEPLLDLKGLLVIDADGLNQLARSSEGWRWLLKRSGPTWITPHGGEFARLFPDCHGDTLPEQAAAAAARSGAVVLLKGAHSVVAAPSGEVWQLTDTDPAVARTGFGDLLAGHAAGWGARCLAADGSVHADDLAASALMHAQSAKRCDQGSSAGTVVPHLAAMTRKMMRF